jgi:hypothetical protein
MNNEDIQKMFKKSRDVHKVWHSFCDYMKKWYFTKCHGWKKDLTRSKREYKVFDCKQMVGYEAMCRVSRYAKDKDGILITGCDDSHHMGSDIALIVHDCEDRFMGTTMILMPQCGTDINQVFLYPHHLDRLIEKLQVIQERQRRKDVNK